MYKTAQPFVGSPEQHGGMVVPTPSDRAELDTRIAEVMVVSRDEDIRGWVTTWLASHGGMRALFFNSPDQAMRRFRTERPAFVVIDVARAAALGALDQFRRTDPDMAILAVSTDASTGRVVEAMKFGATDVVNAPFQADEVDLALGNAMRHSQSSRQRATLQREVRSQHRHTMLFGGGDAMVELQGMIDRVLDVDVPVLIQGETGTGKELVARALAAPSLLRGQPFVKVNCAALPGDLFEAELFGFDRGAFTGAVHAKPGKFEIANGGTIFLDEIGEIPLDLQSKLLQVLQDGHFCRVGGSHEIRTGVRVIAATNRDLNQSVADGQFRGDLLFRLNVIPMQVPPLRERRDDIPLLADLFLKRYAVFHNRPYAPMSSEMMSECLRYRWPGNIRELENLMQRTIVLGTETPARQALARHAAAVRLQTPADPAGPDAVVVPLAAMAEGRPDAAVGSGPRSLKQVARVAAHQAEAMAILRMLQQTGGDQKQAAINLGVCYKALRYKAKESGWRRTDAA